jgi:hypothetical protein
MRRRASAAALRSGLPPERTPVEALAPPWLQVLIVSPIRTVTWSTLTSSSSATICASAVASPWP